VTEDFFSLSYFLSSISYFLFYLKIFKTISTFYPTLFNSLGLNDAGRDSPSSLDILDKDSRLHHITPPTHLSEHKDTQKTETHKQHV
jgi:hypothetical protein